MVLVLSPHLTLATDCLISELKELDETISNDRTRLNKAIRDKNELGTKVCVSIIAKKEWRRLQLVQVLNELTNLQARET